jgi:hypothetical protein
LPKLPDAAGDMAEAIFAAQHQSSRFAASRATVDGDDEGD